MRTVRYLLILAMAFALGAVAPIDWITPDRNPRLEWDNPADMAGIDEIELGIWKVGEVDPIKIFPIEGASLTPGAHVTAGILPHLDNLADGEYVGRLRYVNRIANPISTPPRLNGPWSNEVSIPWSKERAPTVIPINVKITTTQLSGDCNNDGVIDLADAMRILNYLYGNGPKPLPCPVTVIWAQHES